MRKNPGIKNPFNFIEIDEYIVLNGESGDLWIDNDDEEPIHKKVLDCYVLEDETPLGEVAHIVWHHARGNKMSIEAGWNNQAMHIIRFMGGSPEIKEAKEMVRILVSRRKSEDEICIAGLTSEGFMLIIVYPTTTRLVY